VNAKEPVSGRIWKSVPPIAGLGVLSKIGKMARAPDPMAKDAPLSRRRVERTMAVLVNGGLDSCMLLDEMLSVHSTVHPIYLRCGLSWEREELNHLGRFLGRIENAALRPLQILDVPVTDLYRDHWSITGRQVPDADSPDEAVFLPGRNVLLLAKT